MWIPQYTKAAFWNASLFTGLLLFLPVTAQAQLLPGYTVIGKNPLTGNDAFMHVDLNVRYTGGAWTLESRLNPPLPNFRPGGRYAGNEALIYFGEGTMTRLFTDLPPLGARAGQTVYIVPEEFPDGLAISWLGVGAEDNRLTDFQGGNVFLNLLSVSHTTLTGQRGNGQFAIYNSNPFGGAPIVAMTTLDGVSAGDFVRVGLGGHSHYNIGFSEPGFYQITFDANGILPNGTPTRSNPTTFYFGVMTTVEPVPAVIAVAPEPGTLALIFVSGLTGLFRRVRRSVPTGRSSR